MSARGNHPYHPAASVAASVAGLPGGVFVDWRQMKPPSVEEPGIGRGDLGRRGRILGTSRVAWRSVGPGVEVGGGEDPVEAVLRGRGRVDLLGGEVLGDQAEEALVELHDACVWHPAAVFA